MIAEGARVRANDDTDPESVRVGFGRAGSYIGGGVTVNWDSGYTTVVPLGSITEVDLGCTYQPEKWKRNVPDIDGPVLICHTHNAPCAHEAYEDITTTKHCRGPW